MYVDMPRTANPEMEPPTVRSSVRARYEPEHQLAVITCKEERRSIPTNPQKRVWINPGACPIGNLRCYYSTIPERYSFLPYLHDRPRMYVTTYSTRVQDITVQPNIGT